MSSTSGTMEIPTEVSGTSATSQQWQTFCADTPPLWVHLFFFLTIFFSFRNYLGDHAVWDDCKSPENIVPWHLTLFSLLLVMSGIQAVLCAIQALNGLFGTICGDCKCCGCCGVSNDHCPLLLTSYTHRADSQKNWTSPPSAPPSCFLTDCPNPTPLPLGNNTVLWKSQQE